MSLHDEFEIIKVIKKTLGKPSSQVLLGIGDDAAVTKSPKGSLVVTTDALVEGVHFDLAYTTARELGHKALAVNLSDIAAMGATPLYAVVSLGLKQELNEYFIEELYRGIGELAKRHKVDIVGGNVVQSPTAVLVDITIIGQVSKSYFTRSGAKPGDLIAVTGALGTSAAGLSCLKRLGRHAMANREELLRAHLRPEPRVKEAIALQKTGAVTSAIDISDGFAKELHHLSAQSGLGILIDEKSVPISKESLRAATLINSNAKAWALYGGEDYELLFTFSPKKRKAVESAMKKLRCPFQVVGEMTKKGQGVSIVTEAGDKVRLEPKGWNHFVKRAPPKHIDYVPET